ncbi:AAA family ATPase [Chloroflexi bacterium TSY]|nr:AAA family ATPase [Chloroflexi bacterium TSY]
MIKYPYGRRSYYELITEEYLYLDRTHHIRFVEEWGKELLFMRPRRFGKSLWLSTLMNYYDVAKEDYFDRLFGHLAIGQEPTPSHNQYLVMRWDFSRVQSHGSIEQIERALHNQLNVQIQNFQRTYAGYLEYAVDVYPDDSLSSFYSLLSVIQTSGHKLYLFIDEYDNFANEVMMGTHGANQQRYIELVQGEGMFKTLFKNIKSAGSSDGLDRVFMTGVSPIVMNDVTSGANIFEDITWNAKLNDLCDFSETEVRHLVDQVIDHCDLSHARAEEALEQMRNFYNGSRFVTRVPGKELHDVPKVYNPTLTFYFLKELQASCLYPKEMLDGNLEPDGNKLFYVSSHPEGKQLLLDAVEGQTTVSLSELRRRFGVKEMLKPDKQAERLAILLYYLGVLTVGGKTDKGDIVMEIPNLVIRRLYAERILDVMVTEDTAKLTAGRSAAQRLFAQGEIQPLCTFVEQELLPVYDNRDYRDFNELTLKTLFISLLHYNYLYVMDSEPAIRRRYGDLIMMIRPGMRHFAVFDLLMEFQHLKLNELTIEQDGKKRPLSGQEVGQMERKQLLDLAPVQEKLAQAKCQLRDYQQALQEKYGADLKLRTYAIVSVGLDKIVWEEISISTEN